MTSSHDDRDAWRNRITETPIDADLPIIDSHHHIWPEPPVPGADIWNAEQLYAYKAKSGHRIVATIFVEAGTRYRNEGPAQLAAVGETEYAEAVGREAEARGGRLAGTVAGIVACADLMLGDAVSEVLVAHREASRRLRGIRFAVAYDADMPYVMHTRAGMMADPAFREGAKQLAAHGLSLDLWVMQSQLAELCELADSAPDTTIILDHIGTPLGIGRYASDPEGAFDAWKTSLQDVAMRPNVMVKVGGLNMPLTGLCVDRSADAPWSSERMALAQQRHALTAIEIFGPERCMFESNFPVDRDLTEAMVLWNSLKRIAAVFSPGERRAMFFDNAARIYRLNVRADAAWD